MMLWEWIWTHTGQLSQLAIILLAGIGGLALIFDQLDLFGIKARQRRAERREDREERAAEREADREERAAEREAERKAADRAERAAERRHAELLAALTGRAVEGADKPNSDADAH